MSHTGGCLCGAVTYKISTDLTETGACHCSMCRKWSGGVYLGTEIAGDKITVSGTDNLTVYASSPWAERAFCTTCGSSIYYRITAPGPMNGIHHVGIGTLDNTDGINLTGEIFIDKKPAGYEFAGDREKFTEAEFMAMIMPPEGA